MTAFVIHTSQFWDGADQNAFENAVQTYISTLHDFNRVVGKPRPTAHPLVERAVRRVQTQGHPDQYVADYVVIDDTPPPPPTPTLEEKKNKLTAELTAAEFEAMGKVFPARKMRLAHMKYSRAMSIPEDTRTVEHNEDIAHVNNIQAAFDKIAITAALAGADIEDLTEETIANWHLPTFE
jgi:hypothetical protein